MTETIATTPPDIALQICAWLAHCGVPHEELQKLIAGVGSDDLQDAYHGVPNASSELNFCVVAFRDTASNEIKFATSYGHLFGFAAAVVNFNRLPELLTAACRRLGAAPTWHFFDDQGVLELDQPGLPGMSAQDFTQRFYALVSRPFSPAKSIPSGRLTLHLGLRNDFTGWRQGQLKLVPRPGKVDEIIEQLETLSAASQALVSSVMSLIGSMLFLTSNCFDKIGRGGFQAMHEWCARHLRASPHSAPSAILAHLDPSVHLSIVFFSFVFKNLKPKICRPFHRARDPIIIYSDAQWEPIKEGRLFPAPSSKDPPLATHTTGLGIIMFLDGLTIAASGEPPGSVMRSLFERKTQIIPLELLAAASALQLWGEKLQGRDAIWFIDNQSVCAALCKGTSRSTDIQVYSTAFHAWCYQYHISPWIQWVPSDTNPADEPSRSGVSCFCKEIHPIQLPGWANRKAYPDATSVIKNISILDPIFCEEVRR